MTGPIFQCVQEAHDNAMERILSMPIPENTTEQEYLELKGNILSEELAKFGLTIYQP